MLSTWMQVILTMLSAITAREFSYSCWVDKDCDPLLTAACFDADLCNEPAFTLNREAPSWHNAYGFATIALLSASFGLQGAAAEVVGTGVSR